nr:hypothetical protein [Tanacetum cinerariifolium]
FQVVVVVVALWIVADCGVLLRSKLKLLKLVREKISGTQWEALFQQSCFNWVLDQNDWIENCILIHFMLGRQVKVEGDGNENVPLYYDITDKFQIQFGIEEFCLVTGLRFGVENFADYNDPELPIPFRIRVFPSCYDGEHITGYMILEIIEDDVFDRLHHEDAVSLYCRGILQLVLLGVEAKRRIPDWMLRLANDRVGWDNYPWGSFVWPTLYSQLKNANVKHWPNEDLIGRHCFFQIID